MKNHSYDPAAPGTRRSPKEIAAILREQRRSGLSLQPCYSTLAADWFLKYLAAAKPSAPSPPATPPPPVPLPLATPKASPPHDMATKDIYFYSEGVRCYGQLFLPRNFDAAGKTPAVVLAPGWGETHAAVAHLAAQLATQGIAAMAVDYRGWGKRGG